MWILFEAMGNNWELEEDEKKCEQLAQWCAENNYDCGIFWDELSVMIHISYGRVNVNYEKLAKFIIEELQASPKSIHLINQMNILNGAGQYETHVHNFEKETIDTINKMNKLNIPHQEVTLANHFKRLQDLNDLMAVNGFKKCPNCGMSLENRILFEYISDITKEKEYICVSEEVWQGIQESTKKFGLTEKEGFQMSIELSQEYSRIRAIGEKYRIYYDELIEILKHMGEFFGLNGR